MPASSVRETVALEFRIPISPTRAFFSQVRLFDFALRRLGRPYREARLSVMVGDDAILANVAKANPWAGEHVHWHPVPPQVFAEFGLHGTADWRIAGPPSEADLIFLCDADTVLLRDIDPLVHALAPKRRIVLGHMAHHPPPTQKGSLPPTDDPRFWPALYKALGLQMPPRRYDYTIGRDRASQAPPYFNLGFIALTAPALAAMRGRILEMERRLTAYVTTFMRCQLALSLAANEAGVALATLPAAYNAANDEAHLTRNFISADDVRVLHYLRVGEIDRSRDLLPEAIGSFLQRPLQSPINRRFQSLVGEFATTSGLVR